MDSILKTGSLWEERSRLNSCESHQESGPCLLTEGIQDQLPCRPGDSSLPVQQFLGCAAWSRPLLRSTIKTRRGTHNP